MDDGGRSRGVEEAQGCRVQAGFSRMKGEVLRGI